MHAPPTSANYRYMYAAVIIRCRRLPFRNGLTLTGIEEIVFVFSEKNTVRIDLRWNPCSTPSQIARRYH